MIYLLLIFILIVLSDISASMSNSRIPYEPYDSDFYVRKDKADYDF